MVSHSIVHISYCYIVEFHSVFTLMLAVKVLTVVAKQVGQQAVHQQGVAMAQLLPLHPCHPHQQVVVPQPSRYLPRPPPPDPTSSLAWTQRTTSRISFSLSKTKRTLLSQRLVFQCIKLESDYCKDLFIHSKPVR